GAAANGPEETMRLAEPLLLGFAAAQVELSTTACLHTLKVPERPRVSALARCQARRGVKVTNLRHETVPLDDLQRRIVRCLDGKPSRAEIVAPLAGLVAQGSLQIHSQNRPVYDAAQVRGILTQELDRQLPHLARHALLRADVSAG